MRAFHAATYPRFIVARWPADLIGALGVLGITLAATAPLLIGGTAVGQDTAAFFGPMYAFLGDRLRAGELPVWNPYQFSGAPFLADPESGWLYWPAMILFTLLPVATALRVYLVAHVLLAGIATYVFGRLLGLSVAGAVAAGAAYQLSGLVYGRAVCCPAYLQVATWLPVALLATELALGAADWPRRLAWCWLGAFAVSQIFASWLGQGSYYALLVIGGYVLYRGASKSPHPQPLPQHWGRGALNSRPRKGEGWRVRVGVRAALVGIIVVALGVLLAAAAILPRFEFRAASTLAEGYGGDLAWAARQGGWGMGDLDDRLLSPGLTYVGGAVTMLALIALGLAWRRFSVRFFALMVAGTLLLTTTWTNPVQQILFIALPEFEELHRHWPERAMVVFALAPVMLAGATVTALAGVWRIGWRLGTLIAILPIAMLMARLLGAEFHPLAIGGAAFTALLVGLWRSVVRPDVRRLLPGAFALVLTAELLVAGLLTAREGPYGGFHRLDLDGYFRLDGADAFLSSHLESESARFLGYNPVYREIESEHGQVTYYRYHFAEPGTRALLVNNLGTVFALPDVQGYNPLQLQHYVDFMAVLNGTAQEYHGSWVLPTGIDSPLLDLLGVRYVIVPAATPPGRPEIERLARTWPVVYRDQEVRILENPNAFPRGWLVHDVVAGDAETLARGIADGTLDLRAMAVVATVPDGLAPATDPTAEQVTVTHASPESITFRVTASAPALLVTSEVAYPAWHAYVDGKTAPIIRANVAFRAVPVPAGEHTVTFRYESDALTAGLLLSCAGYVGALVTFSFPLLRRLGQGRAAR